MTVTGYMLIYLKGLKRGRPVPGQGIYRDKPNAEEAADKFNYDPKNPDVGVKEIKVTGR